MMRLRKFLVGLVSVAAVGAHAQQGGGEPAMAGMGRMVRGTVTVAGADKLSVKTETGDLYTVALSANTRVMKGREPMKAADIHVGDAVVAMGELDAANKTVHPMNLVVIDAEQVKKMREAMGKTYIAGKVTAIDETKLTVLREDGMSQTITVDEDTAFRKGGRGMQMMFAGSGAAPAAGGSAAGGEAITLADVKVGDSVAGPGSLKGGVFVPTTLMVGTPGQGGGGRRRRQQQGEGAAAPNAEPK